MLASFIMEVTQPLARSGSVPSHGEKAVSGYPQLESALYRCSRLVTGLTIFFRPDAESYCQSYGSAVHIMSINSVEELNVIKPYMLTKRTEACKF